MLGDDSWSVLCATCCLVALLFAIVRLNNFSLFFMLLFLSIAFFFCFLFFFIDDVV